MALTISLAAGPPAGLADYAGHQSPRIRAVPAAVSSSGLDAIDLSARAGLVLDPWERLVLEDALGEREDGRWSAFEVGLVVPRQNGKGAVLTARALAGLYLFGERLILHSAHEVKTAGEAFLRIVSLVDNCDEFRRRVKRINRSHGEEGIELLGGQRLRFIARSRLSGVGFTGDVVILDEAFELPDPVMAALLPTMSARPNPQIWYTSSSVRQQVHPNCHVLASVRRSGIAGDSPRLAYLEWSNPDPAGLDPEQRRELRTDGRALAMANPGLDIRLNRDVIAAELRRMAPEDYDAHRLGIGDWPEDITGGWLVVPRERWQSLADVRGVLPLAPLAFAAEVSWDRRHGVIGVLGARPDGLVQAELAEPSDEWLPGDPFMREGTDWIIPRLLQLRDQWGPCAVVIDGGGPARSLLDAAEDAGLAVEQPAARDVAGACGTFTDLCRPGGPLRHLGQSELGVAVSQAVKHEFGALWAWERKTPYIAPLMAVTLALWGFTAYGGKVAPDPDVF
jgi:hypothetical protein